MSQTLERLRELGGKKIGDPMPEWMPLYDWADPLSALCRDAVAEIEALQGRVNMAEGCAALSGIGVDAHAATVQLSKDTMGKLIEAEKERDNLKVDAERWRALMSSARMHYMGSLGFRFPTKDNNAKRTLSNSTPIPVLDTPWLFGMEFWSEHPDTGHDSFERELMVNYVDAIRGRPK